MGHITRETGIGISLHFARTEEIPRTSLEIQAAAEAELVIQAELQAIQLATTILQFLQATDVLLCTGSQLSAAFIHQCQTHLLEATTAYFKNT